jgi:predicted homoserine dehydrogenase-like protein
MIYTQLFNNLDTSHRVRAGVIGTGHFATAVVAQAASVARLTVPAVADLNVAAARRAFRQAGVPEASIVVCENRAAALDALDCGQCVIVEDALLLMDLPLDVIVESTGVPEAGAKHAQTALEYGKHVVMVNKETDVSIGPILKHKADVAGLVYTQVDGDQHGLLIALIQWARELGLEILCAGKARDAEFIHTPGEGSVVCDRTTVDLTNADALWLAPIPPGSAATYVDARRAILSALPQAGGFDLTEMAIVANAAGLPVDVETLHCPALHTAEIPVVLCPREEGGILTRRGIVDAVTSLRYPEEAGLGGGVFITVTAASDYARHILATKGCLTNPSGSIALIYRPYHLCGVETPMTILCAGLLGIGSGALDYRPHVDLHVRAARDLRAGEILGNDHSPDLQAVIRPAAAIAEGGPLPFHLGNGNRLRVDVPAGTLIYADMVEEPQASVLWTLRQQQDESFLA